jgi:hypothetical protein
MKIHSGQCGDRAPGAGERTGRGAGRAADLVRGRSVASGLAESGGYHDPCRYLAHARDLHDLVLLAGRSDGTQDVGQGAAERGVDPFAPRRQCDAPRSAVGLHGADDHRVDGGLVSRGGGQ